MTTLQELSKIIENKLNGNNDENIILYNLDKIHENTIYKFYVTSTESDYKKADDYNGITTKYINCLLMAVNGENNGINENVYNATQFIDMEILVPDCDDIVRIEANGEITDYRLEDLIVKLLNETLAYPLSQNIGTYYVTCAFDRVIDGIKAIRDNAGISLSYSIPITCIIVNNGIGSQELRIFVYNENKNDYEEFFPDTMTKLRISNHEGVVATSQVVNPISQVITTNTQLVITLKKPLQRGMYFDERIQAYIDDGDISNIKIKTIQPTATGNTGNVYIMSIAEANTSKEEDFAVSTNVKLVESLGV